MLDKQLKKALFELSKNSRIRVKKLSNRIRKSQQSTSYMKKNLERKKLVLDYNTIIDPAKFGLINTIVFFNYKNFNSKNIKQIIEYLENNEYATYIEELSQGADLMVEYCVPNLSLFNKENRKLVHKFKTELQMLNIYPVVVKHLYSKKYLNPRKKIWEAILSGDRDPLDLNENSKKVLSALKETPQEKIIRLAKDADLDPRTLIKIKKELESKKIIRGYSVDFNYTKLNIKKTYVLLQLTYSDKNEITKFLEFTKQHRNTVQLIKLIGKYELLLVLESEKKDHSILNDFREAFHFHDYKILEGKDTLKNTYIPPVDTLE